MKILVIVLLSLTLASILSKTYSWDSTAAKYMPLQVGNVWVYHTTTQLINGGTGFHKYKITGVVNSGGKNYYQVQQTYIHISGNNAGGCGIPFFNNLRLDSNTMNVLQLGGICTMPAGETLLDSLRSRKSDTARICGLTSAFSHCIDTNLVALFGTSFPTKKFNNSGRGNATTYAKGIGIIYWGFTELMTQCNNDLKGCIINNVVYGDTSTIVGISQISTEVPGNFELLQNYPNPFNPTTNIGFRIADFGLVRIMVFDALGREVQTLVNQELSAGPYEVDFDVSNLPSGVYYYRLESGKFSDSNKMALIK